MRQQFFEELERQMAEDETIYFVTADMGYGLADRIKRKYPKRFYNVQAAEQIMITIAVGLVFSGKKAICYSITPFLLYRAYEAIHLYLNNEQTPVILVGSGRGNDYEHDGLSHRDSGCPFDKIYKYYPFDKTDIKGILREALKQTKPTYINLKR